LRLTPVWARAKLELLHFHLSPKQSRYGSHSRAMAVGGGDDRAPMQQNRRFFSDSYGVGAIRELGDSYTPSVTVVK
jgi:hypothetical protein